MWPGKLVTFLSKKISTSMFIQNLIRKCRRPVISKRLLPFIRLSDVITQKTNENLHRRENQNLLKNSIICDVKACSLAQVNRGFGGTYRLHNQQARN
jgi:hypothetical protein